MAKIIIQRDPARITSADNYEYNGNLLDWLIETQPAGFDGLHAFITLNGKELASTSSASGEDVDSKLNITVGHFDTVVIVLRPQGLELLIIAVVALVTYIVAKNMIPDVPDTFGTVDSNNQLNSSSNSYRPYQAIPDIAGQIDAYPDFVQPSYYVYNSAGLRVFREIFCLGVGRYDIGEWYDSDSKLIEASESTVTVYEPGYTVPDLLIVKAVPAAAGTDLLPPGTQKLTAYTDSGEVIDSDTIQIDEATIAYLQLAPGLSVSLNIQYYDVGAGIERTISGTYTVASISTEFVTFSGASFIGSGGFIYAIIINNGFSPTGIWHTLDGDQITEVRFHLIMPAGIRAGDGSEISVTATLTVERLDSGGLPTGTTYTRTAVFTGATTKAQNVTFAINADFGLTVPGRFRAKAQRVTAEFGDGASELLQMERLEGVTPYTTDFGNVTIVDVRRVTSASGGGSRSSSKIHALATRKLRIYDPSTGIYSAAYTATRRFCDYVFYLLYELAGVPIEYIDTDMLYGISDSLSDAQLGYFDYTFDDSNISLRDRVKAACNAARVIPWNDGLIWSFVRDEAKPVKSAMFNRRNLKAAAQSYVQMFRRPADYDSVIIKYVNPDNNTQAQVQRRITTSGFAAGVGVRPLEITLTGCRNVLQATNRADLEVRRLVYQTVTVTDTALNDALLLQKGQRVDWIDLYDSDLFSGEILSVTGDIYKTSERFEPASGVEYWVYITDDQGNTSNSVRAYPRSDGDIFGFEAAGLTGVYIATGLQQAGSRYVIASNNDFDASSFVVDARSRPNELGECQITLLEYNEQMYEMD